MTLSQLIAKLIDLEAEEQFNNYTVVEKDNYDNLLDIEVYPNQARIALVFGD